jgi:hypothetical protein
MVELTEQQLKTLFELALHRGKAATGCVLELVDPLVEEANKLAAQPSAKRARTESTDDEQLSFEKLLQVATDIDKTPDERKVAAAKLPPVYMFLVQHYDDADHELWFVKAENVTQNMLNMLHEDMRPVKGLPFASEMQKNEYFAFAACVGRERFAMDALNVVEVVDAGLDSW